MSTEKFFSEPEDYLDFEPYSIDEKTLAKNGMLVTLNRLYDKPLAAVERVYSLAQASKNNSALILTHRDLEINDSPSSIKNSEYFLSDLANYILVVHLPKQEFIMPTVQLVGSTLISNIDLIKQNIQNNYNDEDISNLSQQLIINSGKRLKFWTHELDKSSQHSLIRRINKQRFLHS
jgi:hypothetical protein